MAAVQNNLLQVPSRDAVEDKVPQDKHFRELQFSKNHERFHGAESPGPPTACSHDHLLEWFTKLQVQAPSSAGAGQAPQNALIAPAIQRARSHQMPVVAKTLDQEAYENNKAYLEECLAECYKLWRQGTPEENQELFALGDLVGHARKTAHDVLSIIEKVNQVQAITVEQSNLIFKEMNKIHVTLQADTLATKAMNRAIQRNHSIGEGTFGQVLHCDGFCILPKARDPSSFCCDSRRAAMKVINVKENNKSAKQTALRELKLLEYISGLSKDKRKQYITHQFYAKILEPGQMTGCVRCCSIQSLAVTDMWKYLHNNLFIERPKIQRLHAIRLLFPALFHGLQFLHDNDIFHRDIKFNNLLLFESSGQFSLKIADLGRAAFPGEGALDNVTGLTDPDVWANWGTSNCKASPIHDWYAVAVLLASVCLRRDQHNAAMDVKTRIDEWSPTQINTALDRAKYRSVTKADREYCIAKECRATLITDLAENGESAEMESWKKAARRVLRERDLVKLKAMCHSNK